MTSFNSTLSVFQDSSNSPPFEGPEKLLEIWFAPSEEYLESVGDPEGLRKVKKATWETMLDLVRCKVLSVIEGEEVDAYLLSESSMFVWPHKLILKTCGTTTLLLGMEKLFDIARQHCGFNQAYRCFYSRKAFMFPERQIGPHRTWDDEVKFLDTVFGEGNGSAYIVGKMNGDHWLLYLTAPKEVSVSQEEQQADNDHLMQEVLSSSTLPSTSTATSTVTVTPLPKSPTRPSPPDQTLEILMTKLAPNACKSFYYPEPSIDEKTLAMSPGASGDVPQRGHREGTALSQRLGIDQLMPGASVDSFLFEPCGYSANMVDGDRYATIHVTPEEDFSYASFECNVDFRSPPQGANPIHSSQQHASAALHDLIARVLSIFQPGRFSISLFISVEEANAGVDQGKTPETRTLLGPNVADGYARTDRILYEFAGYHLLFSTFEKQ